MSTRPVIMIVDDETKQLVAMLNTLMKRFGNDYRIVSHLSASEALEELRQLKESDETVALIIADQWMPEMTGVDVLKHAHKIHPHAQRALLVAWGDKNSSSTILEACAYGHIENYILKPWHPPEVHLYPIVGEFLSEWTAEHVPDMELVRLIGPDPSPRTFEIRMFLERNGIPC